MYNAGRSIFLGFIVTATIIFALTIPIEGCSGGSKNPIKGNSFLLGTLTC